MAGPYWCWLCQRERTDCGGTDGSCPAVEGLAAEYRDDLASGRVKTMFKTKRLQHDNESGMTQREVAKETIDAARRDGREIESVKGYGDIRNPKDH